MRWKRDRERTLFFYFRAKKERKKEEENMQKKEGEVGNRDKTKTLTIATLNTTIQD